MDTNYTPGFGFCTNLFRHFGLMLALASLVTLGACSSFDRTGFQHVTQISQSLPDLMGKASGKYSAQEDKIQQVSAAVEKAVLHAQKRRKNKEIAEAWLSLQTELVSPFFQRWKDKGSLDAEVVRIAKVQVVKSLEAIKKAELARK